jgi:hypothetical protein
LLGECIVRSAVSFDLGTQSAQLGLTVRQRHRQPLDLVASPGEFVTVHHCVLDRRRLDFAALSCPIGA